ncbi:hypothetical protein ACSZNY_05215 [Aeromonas caviae]
MFELLKIIIENVNLWEIILLLVIIWVGRHPEYLKLIQSIKVGDLEIKIKQLEEEVSSSKDEIRVLEQELENDRRLFGDLLEGFDAQTPLPQLAKTRERLIANARTITDLKELSKFLKPSASPEELYAAAVTLRERRPTELFDHIVECLDRLSSAKDLGGIRLNTIWTLTSALHLMLIAAIRDGAPPKYPLYLCVMQKQCSVVSSNTPRSKMIGQINLRKVCVGQLNMHRHGFRERSLEGCWEGSPPAPAGIPGASW